MVQNSIPSGDPYSLLYFSAISSAAAFVNVTIRIFSGGIPFLMMLLIRASKVVVFPLPGQLTKITGPSVRSTALCCSSFNRIFSSFLPSNMIHKFVPLFFLAEKQEAHSLLFLNPLRDYLSFFPLPEDFIGDPSDHSCTAQHGKQADYDIDPILIPCFYHACPFRTVFCHCLCSILFH